MSKIYDTNLSVGVSRTVDSVMLTFLASKTHILVRTLFWTPQSATHICTQIHNRIGDILLNIHKSPKPVISIIQHCWAVQTAQ